MSMVRARSLASIFQFRRLPFVFGWLSLRAAQWRAVIKRLSLFGFALGLLATSLGAPSVSRADDTQQADPRVFAQTGFSISRNAFFEYFRTRGGVATFGYPVSRDFLFMGC